MFRLDLIMLSCGAALVLGTLAPSDAFATECIPPQMYSLPENHPQRIFVDATLWVRPDDVYADFEQRDCRFVAPDSGNDVGADLILHPENPSGADSAGNGCAVTGSRFGEIGELVPRAPLVDGVEYSIVCGTGDDASPWLPDTWLATSEVPPAFEDLQLEVTDVRRIVSDCTRDRYLRLTFEPIDEQFFASYGILLVEYAPDRFDFIRGVEQHESVSIAIIDLPLPEDTTLTIHAVNGLGVEMGAWTVDVTGLGEEGEGGCRTSGTSSNELALVTLVLLGLRRRRAGRARAGDP